MHSIFQKVPNGIPTFHIQTQSNQHNRKLTPLTSLLIESKLKGSIKVSNKPPIKTRQAIQIKNEDNQERSNCLTSLFKSCLKNTKEKCVQTEKSQNQINFYLQPKEKQTIEPKTTFPSSLRHSFTILPEYKQKKIHQQRFSTEFVPSHTTFGRNRPICNRIQQIKYQNQTAIIPTNYNFPYQANYRLNTNNTIYPRNNRLPTEILQPKCYQQLQCSKSIFYPPPLLKQQIKKSDKMINSLQVVESQNILPISMKDLMINSNISEYICNQQVKNTKRTSNLRSSSVNSPKTKKRPSFQKIVVVHGDHQETLYDLDGKQTVENKRSKYERAKTSSRFNPGRIQDDYIKEQMSDGLVKGEQKFQISRSTVANCEQLIHEIHNSRSLQEEQIKRYKHIMEERSKKYEVDKTKSISDMFQVNQKYYEVKKSCHIYKCNQKKSGCIYVLKKILKSTLDCTKQTDNFIRQLQTHSLLNHPNIIQLYYFFHQRQNLSIEKTKYYLVLQYGNYSLQQFIRTKPLPQHQCISYLKDITSGLKFIHQNGVIHRALQPSNIIMVNGVCKINDFRLSTRINSDDEWSGKSTIYTAPQIIKNQIYSYQADCWSLGILAYQMAYGKIKQFNSSTLQNILECVNKNDSITSSDYKDFIRKLLEKQEVFRMSSLQASKHLIFKSDNSYHQQLEKELFRCMQ